MAEEDKEENTEEKEEASQLSPEEYAAQKKKKMMIVIGGGVGALLVIIILVIVMVSGGDKQPEEGAEDEMPEIEMEEPKKEMKDTAKVPGEADMRGKAVFYTIRPVFVVNFQQSKRAKFLQVNVEVMARDDYAIDDVIDNLPLIKNDLVRLFSSQTFDQLRTPEGKEDLRIQATKTVQEVLVRETGRPGIEQILFTQFVMQ